MVKCYYTPLFGLFILSCVFKTLCVLCQGIFLTHIRRSTDRAPPLSLCEYHGSLCRFLAKLLNLLADARQLQIYLFPCCSFFFYFSLPTSTGVGKQVVLQICFTWFGGPNILPRYLRNPARLNGRDFHSSFCTLWTRKKKDLKRASLYPLIQISNLPRSPKTVRHNNCSKSGSYFTIFFLGYSNWPFFLILCASDVLTCFGNNYVTGSA